MHNRNMHVNNKISSHKNRASGGRNSSPSNNDSEDLDELELDDLDLEDLDEDADYSDNSDDTDDYENSDDDDYFDADDSDFSGSNYSNKSPRAKRPNPSVKGKAVKRSDKNTISKTQKQGNRKKNKETSPRKSNRRNLLLVFTILFAFTTICSLVLNFYILKKSEETTAAELAARDAKYEAEFTAYLESLPVSYTQEEVDDMVKKAYDDGSLNKETEIKEFLMEKSSQQGPSLYEILRVFLNEYVVFSGNGQFYFEPIRPDYSPNTVNQDNLVVSDNKIELVENGETVSKMGIDVSEYQGNINWEKVADAGVEFAIMRAGFRGYGTGKLVQDAKLIDNIEGALANDIEVGVYFFTQAITKEEIQEEVDTVMSYIEPYKITGPIVIDVEKIDSDKARGNALSQQERTELVKYFCDAVRKEGYTPMIYGNTYSLFGMLDINQIHDEKIWYAYYTYSFLYYPYKMDIWQYSDKMQIPGINGNVDIDIMFP